MNRASSKELDKILGESFPVLDQGFIRVIDYMGGDSDIVDAARVSYGSGTKKVSEDRGLIRYLMRNRHTSPMEMCEIKLHIKMPMDSWRQFVRHRTYSISEISSRYSIVTNDAQKTEPNKWRLQAKDNKQGSDGFAPIEEGEVLSHSENMLHIHAKKVYNSRIEKGIAREQARKDLPLSTYTEAYVKVDLHNLLHFLSLRMDGHAQLEIRSYANIIGKEIVAKWCPLVWEAFEDYRLDGMSFSKQEQYLLTEMPNTNLVMQMVKDMGWLKANKKGGWRKHIEREEFEQKLNKLSIPIPWRTI